MLGRDVTAVVLLRVEVDDARNNVESLGALTMVIADAVTSAPVAGVVKLPFKKTTDVRNAAQSQVEASMSLSRLYDL